MKKVLNFAELLSIACSCLHRVFINDNGKKKMEKQKEKSSHNFPSHLYLIPIIFKLLCSKFSLL